MKINPNDPKWTAYVLGELDVEDRVAIEELLETSAEARALVEELRIATTMLKDEEVLRIAPGRKEHLGGAARVIARGADRLGYKHKPLVRNAPDCDGKGVCCFGCPTDAKRSTNVSYVPMALKAGAELYTGQRVGRIVFDRGRAVGVVAHSSAGRLTLALCCLRRPSCSRSRS